jgi:haloacetate dehalogenase
MRSLGHRASTSARHDRGARVAASGSRSTRPASVAPDDAARHRADAGDVRGTTEAFARAYWHWFLLIQPAPCPIAGSRATRLLPAQRDGRRHAGLAAFDPEALAEYERCIRSPARRARSARTIAPPAGIDLEHDRADRAAGRRVDGPLRVLWAAHGTVGACFDVLAAGRPRRATSPAGAVDCGHYIAEERPAELLAEIDAFFKED